MAPAGLLCPGRLCSWRPDNHNQKYRSWFLIRGCILLSSLLIFLLGLHLLSNTSTSTGLANGAWRRAYTSYELGAFDIMGDIDIEPIRALCAERSYQPGIVFQCEENDGGISNLRNSILTCLRYAAEFGAELVMPRLKTRNPDDLAQLNGETVDLAYLFDVTSFRENVLEACPHLKLWPTLESIPNHDAHILVPDYLDPTDWGRVELLQLINIKHLRQNLAKWINRQTGAPFDGVTKPVIIRFQRNFFAWDQREDAYAVWTEWAKLLPLRRDAYYLAAETLAQLATAEGQVVNHTQGIQTTSLRFIGSHLRSEADASREMRQFGFDQQLNAFLQVAEKTGIKVLYVASGDSSETQRAEVIAAERGITMYTKYSLLQGPPRDEMLEMTFDQQALIDYLVLLRSTKFVGVDSSSFSGNIAVTRHASTHDGTYWVDFADSLSIIVGGRFSFLRHCMWP